VGEGLGDDNDGDDDHVPGAHYFGRGILFFWLKFVNLFDLEQLSCMCSLRHMFCFPGYDIH